MGGGGGGGGFPNTKGGNQNTNTKARFFGKPGEKSRNGYAETRYGSDGKADMERHHTNHGNPKAHSNPHDHMIEWNENGDPDFGKGMNYWDGNVPKF